MPVDVEQILNVHSAVHLAGASSHDHRNRQSTVLFSLT